VALWRGCIISRYRKSDVERDPLAIDGTQVEHTIERYRYPLQQEGQTENENMLTALIFIASMLDVGRTRIDQMPKTYDKWRCPTSVMLTDMICSDWARLSDMQMDQLRDELCDKIRQEPNQRRSNLGSIMDTLFQNIPQVTSTHMCVFTCFTSDPNTVMVLNPRFAPIHQCVFRLDPPTISLEASINGFYAQTYPDDCPMGPPRQLEPRCVGNHKAEYVVVDDVQQTRLISFNGGGIDFATAQVMRFFDILHIDARIMRDDDHGRRHGQVHEKVVGCLIAKDTEKGGSKRYVVRWKEPERKGNRMLHFDSSKSRLPSDVSPGAWFTGLENGKIEAVVLRRAHWVRVGDSLMLK